MIPAVNYIFRSADMMQRDIALDYSATSLVTRGGNRRMGVAHP